MIQLYIYYDFLNNKAKHWHNDHNNTTTLSPDDYCLVNKNWVDRYKKSFDYDMIIPLFNIIKNHDNYKFDASDKKIYEALKNMEPDIYLKYNKDFKNKEFDSEYGFIIDEKNVVYNDVENHPQQISIPHNFEILPKELIKKIMGANYTSDRMEFTNCKIIDNLFVIDFPFNLNGCGKYISLIGELDDNNSLEIKSFLIYFQAFQKDIMLEDTNLQDLIKINKKDFWITKVQNNEEYGYDTCYAFQFNKDGNVINNNFGIIENYIPNDDIKPPRDDLIPGPDDDLIPVPEVEYNLDYQVMYPYINTNYPYPPLIGLDNIGATCYMNATLQCFCNILPFVNYFKYDKNLIYRVKNDIGKKTLSSSFKLLIEKLWPNDLINKIKSYSPHEFKAKISYMNELFRGVAANDSKDLVNFIIMTLHEELNMIQNQIIPENNNYIDQTNMQAMYNSFIRNFNATNRSEISRLFYATNYNITKCVNCKVESYNFQTYFFIIFPLEEIRKYILSLNQMNNFNFNNNMINNKVVDIFNCFDYDCKINTMSGANAMYCNYCRQTCSSSMCTKLFTGPEILIIILNRGKGKEFDVKINFYEILNLQNYIGMPNTGFIYNLIGVITHIGESGMAGHFISYCKNPINNTWNKYNDSIVTPVKDFKSEVIDFAMPYLLFYQKQH